MEKYDPEEVVLCETVMEAVEIVPIMLCNLANKIVKTIKGEKVGRALPI